MSEYFINEGSFDLPDVGFEDRTETVLHVDAGSDGTIEVRIQRGPRPDDLDAFADERADSARAALRGCTLVFRRRREDAAVETIDVGIRYRGPSSVAYRRELYTGAGNALFVTTVTGRIQDWERVDHCIESIANSASFRDAQA